MSKTDKTDPSWVKALRKDSPEIKEYHDHTKKDEDGYIICDIDDVEKPNIFYWQRRGSCAYDVSYYGWNNGFYARPPRGKEIRNLMEGANRAKWRKARQDMLKLDPEDMEDYDVKSYQNRHSALWEMY